MQNQQAANGRRSRIVLELHSAFVIERRRKAPTWSERLRMPDCELAPIIAFAIAAVVGDITRFANPKKLVAYLGLAPSVADSGLSIRGRGGLVPFGRGDLRALLIQSSHNALRQRNSPLHAWGWKLCLRKSNKNVAVAAVARKLSFFREPHTITTGPFRCFWPG
jgi:transposase